MQNFLHTQENFKVSYNIINKTVDLLISYKINEKNYDVVSQSFDTLTEFI